jgi:NifU-like protein involved in Fe-S cluster formation
MSDAPKETPYIYQPFGINDKAHWDAGRIYAIAADSMLTEISGLTKPEAERILSAMKES